MARQIIPGDRTRPPAAAIGAADGGDTAELTGRIALARSILAQRSWAWQDERHVRDALAALDGSGIAEILQRAG